MFNVDVSKKANALCALIRIELDGKQRVLGSGFFFMQQDVVATAKHILQDHEGTWPPCYLRVQPLGTRELYRPVQGVYHAEQDLAFIHLDRPHQGAYPLMPATRTEAGFVYVAHDPTQEQLIIRWVPRFRVGDPRDRRHSVEYSFEWGPPTRPGNSGGPLIATDGGVAAILSEVTRTGEAADCEGQLLGTGGRHARAVWIGPLFDTYLRWKYHPEQMLVDDIPFVIPSQ